MSDYIKCPRCELNYIKKDEQYCQVCKAELKLGPQLMFAVDEDEDEYEEDSYNEEAHEEEPNAEVEEEA